MRMSKAFCKIAFVFMFSGYAIAASKDDDASERLSYKPLVISGEFVRPKELEPNVQFWKRVYSEWSSDEIALSDRDDLRLVYYVVKLPMSFDRIHRPTYENILKNAKEELVRVLQSLDEKRPSSERGLQGMERDVYIALKDIPDSDKYSHSDNIRAQVGRKDTFAAGLENSGHYDMEIRERLKASGLPEELVALVFAESMFFAPSHSKAGAKGLWQFVKGTAKQYGMYMNPLVDERLDPVLSTDAAIQYLKDAKRILGEWPLVITSYNYGTGIRRAADAVGSRNLVDIIRQYQGKRFGFASKNYYSEFLAALDVYANAQQHFPGVKPAQHWDYDMVKMPYSAYVRDLVAVDAVEKEWLLDHNPALSREVQNGQEIIPKGYILRVPKETARTFFIKLAKANQRQKDRAEAHIRIKHRANGKQTIKQIAGLYDVFVSSVSKRLGLQPGQRIKRGTVVEVRSEDTRYSEIPAPLYQPSFADSPKDAKKSRQGKKAV